MKLYTSFDLHANNSYLGIKDETGKPVFRKKLPNEPEKILNALSPYKSEIVGIVVESTYNWYWLVDLLMKEGYKVYLANTSAIQKYSRMKHADDQDCNFSRPFTHPGWGFSRGFTRPGSFCTALQNTVSCIPFFFQEGSMAYKKHNVTEILDILRRVQAGDGKRKVARGTGIDRNTIRKYLTIAKERYPFQVKPEMGKDKALLTMP